MKVQQHLKTQRKIAWFARQKSWISRSTTRVYYNKSLTEELEVLAKTKDVISEKTDDSEYRDNRSMLSPSGGLAIELTKSENSIGLVQLASRVDFAMHAETSDGDDPFAKVKGLISDMITRLEEKASEDLYLMTSMIPPRITQLAGGDEHLPSRSRKQHHQLQGDVELPGSIPVLY